MDKATLILDGDCGLCNRAAMFLKPRLSKNKKIIFLTNESKFPRAFQFNRKTIKMRDPRAPKCRKKK